MNDFLYKRWLSASEISMLSCFKKAIISTNDFLKLAKSIGKDFTFFDPASGKSFIVKHDRNVFVGGHKLLLASFRSYKGWNVVYLTVHKSKYLTIEGTNHVR